VWSDAECVGLENRRLTLLPRRITLSLASVKPLEESQGTSPRKLLEQVSDIIRLKQYSPRPDLRDLRSQDQSLHPEPPAASPGTGLLWGSG